MNQINSRKAIEPDVIPAEDARGLEKRLSLRRDEMCRTGNHRDIKLMFHIKALRKVIEERLRHEMTLKNNSDSCHPDAIFILLQAMEQSVEKHRELHLISIDLEKARQQNWNVRERVKCL